MFTTKISKDEYGNTIINFYAKVAQEAVFSSLNEMVEKEVREHVRREVRALLEKPLKARVLKELKEVLGESVEK